MPHNQNGLNNIQLIKKRWLVPVIVLICFRAGSALAVGTPENVLVVQNGASPTSAGIAAYYVSCRSIPVGNLVTVYTQDSSLSGSNESISLQDYQAQIEQPIKTFLTDHNLVNQIQFIVLTKGIPHRLKNDPLGGPYGGRSVDNVLAATDLVNPLQLELMDSNNTYLGSVYANRYWRATDPFSHSKYGGYLVTRLDGYTEADAKALVDRALAVQYAPLRALLDVDPTKGMGDPALQPKGLIDADGNYDPNYELTYADYNADMVRASQVLSARPGISVQLDQTSAFVGSSAPLTCYCSWGSNDGHYDSSVYFGLDFAAASIAETAVSTSARSFLPTTYGQSLIVDLIKQRPTTNGTAGAKGYVTEPFLDAVASPTVHFDLYLSGRNLAESYYAASRFVGWKDVVVGDPLCAVTGQLVSTVSAAKALSDGSLLTLSGMTVSAGADDFGDSVYVQDRDRASGIQVRLGGAYPGIVRHATVDVRGILATADGERYIQASTAIPVGSRGAEPLGMTNRSLGGGDWKYELATGEGQRGVLGGSGLNNIGLLVRVVGRIVERDTASPATWFKIDDGGGVNVKCLLPSGVTVEPSWLYVGVTGISSCEKSGDDLLRLIRVRDADDITVCLPVP